jgi:cytoplasmic iron level regulating protein YaaA (DUF328/UPF0246 family)
MLAVVSPAKALNFDPLEPLVPVSHPRLLDGAAEIGDVAKKRSRAEFKKLMHLSDTLADLTYERFQAFDATDPLSGAKPAVFAYAGDTYRGLDVSRFSDADLTYAQDHLRILSGLYGLLKPMDLIKAHRLEMGTKLKNPRGQDLYAFWGERIAELLNEDCDASGGAQAIINCASVEYFKSVDQIVLSPEVITPVFKEEAAGVAKIISFHAKKARGMMAAYMVRHQIDRPEGLKEFDEEGYMFRPQLSDASTYVFTRLQG